ncbi:hypothetical protein BGY98DRAFT_964680 [Russula aff. rugulosa BPL654]|nr:hypothetical protein BGY98DRAFT_964680 [Russula aff. rugulosa BPL654]
MFIKSSMFIFGITLARRVSLRRMGWKEVICPSPDRQNNPGGTRFALSSLRSSLLCGTSPHFSSLPIAAPVEGSTASFRIPRKFGTLISAGRGQHVATRLPNRASRQRLISCTYPLISF